MAWPTRRTLPCRPLAPGAPQRVWMRSTRSFTSAGRFNARPRRRISVHASSTVRTSVRRTDASGRAVAKAVTWSLSFSSRLATTTSGSRSITRWRSTFWCLPHAPRCGTPLEAERKIWFGPPQSPPHRAGIPSNWAPRKRRAWCEGSPLPLSHEGSDSFCGGGMWSHWQTPCGDDSGGVQCVVGGGR